MYDFSISSITWNTAYPLFVSTGSDIDPFGLSKQNLTTFRNVPKSLGIPELFVYDSVILRVSLIEKLLSKTDSEKEVNFAPSENNKAFSYRAFCRESSSFSEIFSNRTYSIFFDFSIR